MKEIIAREDAEPEEVLPEVIADTRPVVRHVPLPEQVKAIYMSSCVAGTPSFRSSLVRLINETELNAVVLDIKDYSGTISFNPGEGPWHAAWMAAECGALDMRAFIEMLHDNNIFVIGRITVFQDLFYTKVRPDLAVKRADGVTVWQDHKGLSFIDVGAREYWGHVVELSRLSYNIGFDELNYDYVRYPSDGNMADTAYTHSATGTKQENLETFFAYLHEAVGQPERYAEFRHENTGRATATPWTSADLFGMTTTNTDDLSIGQVQERAAPYFDFIAPMVYPSHYPGSFLGLGNPNLYPYKIVHYAMSEGVKRMESDTTTVEGFMHARIGTSTPAVYRKPVYTADKFRTWIQDFDYGGDYDAADVRAQIQASYDAGVMSWMIWAPSNRYTREALHGPEGAASTTEPAVVDEYIR
ncbi:MAG: putative glycoside hydrolase [Candidatus Pacebacteria bacterium]|nr:putative glycoside hydrolase [Candidatus Paceibacterota bacterium]